MQIQQSNSYRPDGLRHRRTDNTGTTQTIWDGDDPMAQVDLGGNLVQYWTWAPELPEGRWSRLVKSRFPATNAHPDQYLHSDWLGTVVAVSLPDGTALLRSGTHPRPWGEEDSAAVGPLSWVGNQGYWRENQLARSMHCMFRRCQPGGVHGRRAGWHARVFDPGLCPTKPN